MTDPRAAVYPGGTNDQKRRLIVGAGPSGLFAAGELARHGVGMRLIEREVQPHRQVRATAIQPGTLEGATYQGYFLVADIAMQAPFSRDESIFARGLGSDTLCGREGKWDIVD
jgi:2-polyprenyl-6-methoxyphenol hydroxylase-like FAD-dependent oxidoreductase